jgi:hypothetical protein
MLVSSVNRSTLERIPVTLTRPDRQAFAHGLAKRRQRSQLLRRLRRNQEIRTATCDRFAISKRAMASSGQTTSI